ncbi:uncharacterized protein PWA37_004021 [Arxiozyma heterogenica]|uniref:Uncharacterized protein n=1 Tax=Arxiozyma heterogenica TaxID=278026 RepID=A0AAN7WPM5_9SACH|nr:hypothetical protein RI543_003052 [Kazachstania heterogenica]
MPTKKISSPIKLIENDTNSANVFAVDITLDAETTTSKPLARKKDLCECVSMVHRFDRSPSSILSNENGIHINKITENNTFNKLPIPIVDSFAENFIIKTSVGSNKRNEMHFIDINIYKELYVRDGISIFEIFPSIKKYKPNSYLNAFACLPNDQSYYYCQVVEKGGKCCAYKYKSTEFKRPFRRRNDALNKHFARHHLKDAKDETLHSNLNEYQASKLLEKSRVLQNSIPPKENHN